MGDFSQRSATQKGGFLAGMLLLAACVAPTSNVPKINPAELQAEEIKQQAIVIEERDKLARRLVRVGTPILAANTEQCGNNIVNKAGVNFTTALLNTSITTRRATVLARGLSRAGEVRVSSVVPGMPAAGILFEGDIVTRINGINAYNAMSGAIPVNFQLPNLRVGVLRDGQQLNLSVPTVPVCSYRVLLSKSPGVQASAGNNMIIFSVGMMQLMDTDRDLALIFGHELAHLTRNHQNAKKTNQRIGELVGMVVTGLTGVDVIDIGAKIGRGAFSQEFESEADYVGMYHASRAGWDMTGAGNAFRRLAIASPASIHSVGGTHPSAVSRALLVEQTVLEIQNKRENQLALVPNFKDLPATNIPASSDEIAKQAATFTSLPTVASVPVSQPDDAEQQYRRGVQFENGIDRGRDYARAIEWYRKAADQGHRSALYNLGMMYVNGRGVQQNNGEAVIYFRQAAEKRHAKAHFNLGFMMENGRGTAKDPARGLTNYIIASNLGLGEIANDARDKVSAQLSPAQIREAERRAKLWMDAHRR
ncbi:MAG: M48 family metalloprotease [Alphaproteobacteria bacterium]|nr:M48 family metalloprotease [Alphaproteobacteria bacterium]